MDVRQVADWLRKEHTEFHELADRLRQIIATRPRGDLNNWLRSVRDCYEKFRGKLVQHLRVEEEGGYLQPVIAARPTLSRQVDLLHNEHRQLRILLDETLAALGQLEPSDNLLIRERCQRIEGLVRFVESHEEHENHMVLFAFTQELGADD